MASTPSNRLKLTPSNSPFYHRVSRSPTRTRIPHDTSASTAAPSRLSLKRVVGSTCSSPAGFDTVDSSFAYIAGGAVVVVDVRHDHYRQRFFRARPTAVPTYAVSPIPHNPSTPNSTPKANDSRNRTTISSHRDSPFSLAADWSESPTSGKTWTQRERIKSATCLSLSRDGRFLAVGETGYAPRVLIFNLDDSSSDTPLVSISEHSFGVTAVAWSTDSKYLSSLGTANDGFLYVWKIDPRTGSAKLFQQNRCTSFVRGMLWLSGSSFITFGVRHIKAWRVEETPAPTSTSPTKPRYTMDGGFPTPPSHQPQIKQKTLPGRNILLGSLLEATFVCAALLSDGRAVICTDSGDIGLLETVNKQTKLVQLRDVGFPVSCVSARDDKVCIAGKHGQSLAIEVDKLLAERNSGESTPSILSPTTTESTNFSDAMGADGLIAVGFLTNSVVTVDTKRSIDIFASADYVPGTEPGPDVKRIPIPGHKQPIMGVQSLPQPNVSGADFFTWSSSGNILLWNLDGEVKSSLQIPVEQLDTDDDIAPINHLSVVRATKGAKLFVTADRLGVLRIIDSSTEESLLEIKAHASDCQSLSIFEDDKRLIVASCGRDRTAQLLQRLPDGTFEHFQTLEFAAKVVKVLLTPDDKVITCSFDRTLQVHELVAKEDDPHAIAAIPTRVITLKASPSSMALSPDARTIYVSLLDRTICHYDLTSGRLLTSFRCIDEGGSETAVLDSLIYGKQVTATPIPAASPPANSILPSNESTFLLGLSNTDKSVRVYNAQTGAFLDREWGHTEAITGVALIESREEDAEVETKQEVEHTTESVADSAAESAPENTTDGVRKVVSVGSDGTILIWSLDLRDPVAVAPSSRDPSPVKDGKTASASTKTPLRKVLSKAELAEFQKSTPTGPGAGVGRRSPIRSLSRKTSARFSLSGIGSAGGGGASGGRVPITSLLNHSPASTIEESPASTSSRRESSGAATASPPIQVSPQARVRRRPSLPAMGTMSTPTGAGGGGGSSSGALAARKKNSVSNLRSSYGLGSLTMATEQTSRQLRSFRKRLASTDPIAQDVLVELDQELRLTMAALGDRAVRSKALSDELDGLLDEKLERLVALLDEKWRLQHKPKESEQGEMEDKVVGVGPPAAASSTSFSEGRPCGHNRDESTASEVVSVASEQEQPSSGGGGRSSHGRGSSGGENQSCSHNSSNSVDTGNTSPDEYGEASLSSLLRADGCADGCAVDESKLLAG